MGILDNLRNSILNWLMPGDEVYEARQSKYSRLRDYYEGTHKKNLKVKPNQADDNLASNFVGLIVERSISMLFGKGVKFELPDEAQDELIEKVFNANKRDIFFHKLGQYGSIYGTVYTKIIPDAYGPNIPRYVALDPNWMTITTDPEDIETVVRYTARYNIIRGGKEIARREVIERVPDSETWVIINEEATSTYSGRWVEIDRQEWPYPFAPIVHWQNLPQADNIYGQADIEDILDIQDRYNFVMSNVSRIVRYHAHPKTWMRGGTFGANASWGADELVTLQGENAQIANLEMQSDLASSITYAQVLRQSIFDIGRTVDITSLQDKIGALTNFGIRVLYTDAIAKISSKRALYGEGLQELCKRTLALAGADYYTLDVGTLQWGDTLPVDTNELVDQAKAQLEMGIVSKQTVAGQFDIDWELEQERIKGEKAGEDNLGAALLRAFDRGQ